MTEIPKMKNIRLPSYLKWIRTQPCLFKKCFSPTEPHHIRKHTDGGVALKPSDCFVVPLCRKHHREWHDRHKPTAEYHLVKAAEYQIRYLLERGEYKLINDALRGIGESMKEIE